MITNNIFIDTSVFYKENFSFGKFKLGTIEKLCSDGVINLMLTDVTIQEIEKNMSEMVEEAIRAHRRFTKDGKILRNIDGPMCVNKFKELSSEEIKNALLEKLATFTKLAAKIVPVDSATPSEVFKRYFEMRSPFGSKNKKHEFPDAFILNALEKWCSENKAKLYIVAGDGDFKEYCRGLPNLIPISSLAEMLDVISKSNEYTYNLFHKIFEQKIEEVSRLIKKEIEDHWFILGDEDGEVIEIEVKKLTLGEYYITSQAGNTFALSIDVDVIINAEVEYNDFSTATYDSEDKCYFFRDTVHTTLERELAIEVSCKVEYDLKNEDSFKVEEVRLEDKDLCIFAHEYEY